MKRYSLVFAVFALLLMAGSIASANFPSLTPPDTTVSVVLKQGFYQDSLVWFFTTDTNDINFASTYVFPFTVPTLAQPLTSAYDPTLDTTGRKMFINVSLMQGPVFTAVPTQTKYSGIWSVVFIKFKPGQARTVTNTNPWNAVTNPSGFPTPAQADLLRTYGTSRSGVVVDSPIAAVGPLDSGVWPRNNSNPTVLYRLPQVMAFNLRQKLITLPAWFVYSKERFPGTPPASFYIDKCTVIVPDVANPILAARLKANLAPALNLIDPANVQNFYFIDGRIFGATPPIPFIAGGPVGILADVNQWPVIQWSPDGMGINNRNAAYTPVMNFDILEGGPNFPFSSSNRRVSFANNAPYIELILLPGGIYINTPDERINAPVLGATRIRPPIGGCPDCP
jgi:hypothetical protein